MEDAEEEKGMERRAGGAGRLKAHPIGADAVAAVVGPFTAGTVPTEEERNNGAGHN